MKAGETNVPTKIELVAAEAANSWYIKVGNKYLASSATTNRKLALVDTETAWVAAENTNGGIQLTSNGVSLGTAGAESKMLRTYANAGTLKYGLVFFKEN